MPAPPKRPVPSPLPPPRKPCEDCKGSGKKPLKYLGEVTDPCPRCAGSGVVEVVEEKLTPFQQEVLTLLARIADSMDYFITQDKGRGADILARIDADLARKKP